MLIEVSDNQSALAVDTQRLVRAAEAILSDAGVVDARVSIAVVDDPTIHQLNRQFLAHDYPTDVLSFLLDREGSSLEGEVVVSGDTAARVAADVGWPGEDELLLYVVHGVLHLVGHDDATPQLRATMQDRESHYLAALGVQRREVSDVAPDAAPNVD